MINMVILHHIVQLTNASLRVYASAENEPEQMLLCLTPDNCSGAPLPASVEEFLQEKDKDRLPVLVSVEYIFFYAFIPTDDADYLLGPVQLSTPLSLRKNLPGDKNMPDLQSIPQCDAPVFLQAVLLLWNLFSETELLMQQLLTANCSNTSNTDVQQYYSKLTYENRENGNHHNSYSQEVRLLSSIEHGDMQMLKQCQIEKLSGSFGVLSHEQNRSIRNVCIAVIVLVSRAAIRGGMNPESAFSLCDSYIMKIEETQDLHMLQPLVEGAQTNFASIVHSLQQDTEKTESGRHHPLVKKIKNYVYDHLHGKITLQEVADVFQTNPNYISTLFKRYEEISFSDFVMREKIDLAKNLLIYSALSGGTIAATLGFSSQSHFGKVFKQWTGMTPVQFQHEFAITELQEK